MVTDRREYIRLDVAYLDNPKIAEVLDESHAAVVLHIASMALARQHRTDGVVSRKQIMRRAGASDMDAAILLRLGLWHDVGDGKVEVHDYAKHQETRDEIEARSKKQRENARKRWDSRGDATRNADGTFSDVGHTDDLATGDASGIPNGSATGTSKRNARRNAEESRGEERREDGGRPPSAGAREAKPPALDVQGALAAAGLPPNDHEPFLQALRDSGIRRPPGYVMRAHHDDQLRARIAQWRDDVAREANAPRVIQANVAKVARDNSGRVIDPELCEHGGAKGACPMCKRKGDS